MSKRKIPLKFFDKELGWLLFNERVLSLSESQDTPPLERLNFHNIFHSNLDEFFMKRVGKLRADMKGLESKYPLRAKAMRHYIQSLVTKITELELRSINNLNLDLLPKLNQMGVLITTPDQLSHTEKKSLKELFDTKVFPLLTPMIVDNGHPFPLISNLNYSLGFVIKRPGKTQKNFVRVKIPPSMPLWVKIPSTYNKHKFVNLLDTVLLFQDDILPHVQIESIFSFRITRSLENRNQDSEEAEDLLELMAEEIRMRKYSEIVRIEYFGELHPWAKQFLQRELEIKPDVFFKSSSPLPFKKIDAPVQLKSSRLKFKAPSANPFVTFPDDTCIFKKISENDILVHHPFDSFSDSVEAFLRQSAEDPNVVYIKMTLYRVGNQSPIIEALCHAAHEGKSVVCLVELKARLDEERNIQWAKKLEAAGVHVIYGVLELKTHAKICIVIREENDTLKTYVHVGTGNYNGQTAKLYTDLGLFTSEPKLTKDLSRGFNYLTGMAGLPGFKQILVSPLNLKKQLLELIEKECRLSESGKRGKIIIKCNNLDDVDVVKALYRASTAGVSVTLIIRGFSTLIPGIAGLSENIRVISILGRLLEHSRIYYFGDGKRNQLLGKFYIGSCDVLRRSFQRRVELIVPVEATSLKKTLWSYLSKIIHPNCLRWEMQSDGNYLQIQNKNSYDVQQIYLEGDR